ncbi:MAG: putative LPS assembly protein LptD, partial [Bacteroidota bacterium]
PTDEDTTKHNKATIYNSNALITTCDDPHPHFGIRTNKLKVIPDKLVVTGFSNVEIAGIPTPLVLPFGFYPITKTRKAGVIIPKDFEFATAEGLGLRDFGWYQPINDHMDATLLFNAYASGTFGAALTTRYEKKYHFSSEMRLKYNNRVSEDRFAIKQSAKSFSIYLRQEQDPKAHPSRKFGGSINIETNRDQNRNRNDYNSVYQNTLSSNLNFSKSFPGRPFQLNVGLSHSQNTQTRIMNIKLPTAQFTMQRIYPFKRKNAVGKEHWYEKLSLNYNSAFDNNFTAVDTQLFTRKTLQNARMGMQHRASTDYNIKIFKYLNIAPAVSLTENWYPYQIEKKLIKENRLVYDTIRENGEIIGINLNESKSKYGVDTTIRHWNFNAYREVTASISANTALFYTKQFKHGWFRGIRHTIKPSVSTGFGQDYTKARYDRYYKTYETDTRQAFNDTVRYGVLDDGIYGRPPSTRSSRDLILGYSLVNILEFKYFNAKRDTVYKKRIFDNLGFNGTYNFSADTLKWSTISTGGLFRLFKGITNLTWSATFDPYIADAKGRRINKFVVNERGRLLRTTNLGIQVNTNCTIKQLRELFSNKKKDDSAPTSGTTPRATVASDEFVDWFDDFRLSHRIAIERRLIPTGYGTARDTVIVSSHNISIAGSLQLTSKWALNIGNVAYDLQRKQLVYPDLGFTRDLHCWALSLSWQPVRGTYMFSIYAKPGSLDFLKIPYRKNYYDARL